MENNWYIGLTAKEINVKACNGAWKIAYSVDYDSSLDEIENAYDRLCDYDESQKNLYDKIVDIKTSLYAYNETQYKEWDNTLTEIKIAIYEHKEMLGNMYLTLNRERKAN